MNNTKIMLLVDIHNPDLVFTRVVAYHKHITSLQSFIIT